VGYSGKKYMGKGKRGRAGNDDAEGKAQHALYRLESFASECAHLWASHWIKGCHAAPVHAKGPRRDGAPRSSRRSVSRRGNPRVAA